MKIPTMLAFLAPLALSACGVPDIIAHEVKAYEKSQDQRDQASQPQNAPTTTTQQSTPQQHAEPEPPPLAPPLARESVSKEQLK